MTTTLNLRSPEDLLAAAPVVLGFVPTDSAVMFTFDGPSCFHARVDLPRVGEEVDECIEALLLRASGTTWGGCCSCSTPRTRCPPTGWPGAWCGPSVPRASRWSTCSGPMADGGSRC